MCLVDFSKTFSSNKHFSELRLFAPLERHKIIAIYDLIMQTSAEKIIIFDWKTAMNRPKSRYIFDKPQSLVYPYVLRKNYEALFPGIQQKPHITMIYWYPEFPNDTLRLDYSDERHVETVPLLKDQLNAINKNIEDNHFPLTNNKAKCKYCPYRSLCDRGVFAGELKDLDQIVPAEEEIEINFLDLPALDLHI